MKAIVYDFYTDIFLNTEEVTEHCKPGEGDNTCVWLTCGSNGWQCCKYHKPFQLIDRLEKGETTAKRDGCDKVNNFWETEEDNIYSDDCDADDAEFSNGKEIEF